MRGAGSSEGRAGEGLGLDGGWAARYRRLPQSVSGLDPTAGRTSLRVYPQAMDVYVSLVVFGGPVCGQSIGGPEPGKSVAALKSTGGRYAEMLYKYRE